MRPRPASRAQAGLTLIEVVVVILILAVLAAVVTTQYTDAVNTGRLNANKDLLISYIRLAQERAMKQAATWGAASNGAQFWVFSGANPAVSAAWINLPGSASTPVSLTANGFSTTSFTLLFDQYGRPYNASLAAPLTANLTVTITSVPDPARTLTLTVIPETGFLQ
jgi:prepilin-type N-terminal cleavage/methylation domain-containing protein